MDDDSYECHELRLRVPHTISCTREMLWQARASVPAAHCWRQAGGTPKLCCGVSELTQLPVGHCLMVVEATVALAAVMDTESNEKHEAPKTTTLRTATDICLSCAVLKLSSLLVSSPLRAIYFNVLNIHYYPIVLRISLNLIFILPPRMGNRKT